MKKLNNTKLILALFTLMGLYTTPINALERRPIESIPTQELTKETMGIKSNGDSLKMAWYLLPEAYGLPPQPVVLIAVVKAKMNPFGVTTFSSEIEAQRGLKVTYTNSKGIPRELVPVPKTADISNFVTFFKPFFSNFAGEFGEGMWFFTYKNVDLFGNPIVSPYEAGELKIDMGIPEEPSNIEAGELKIDMGIPEESSNIALINFPLNSLFVPRVCPGGKPAHVSWKYCPWDGTPLRED
ncbi:hypothetical protein [Moorena producens]|uniref:hypothetical protein n=1 Tax=Moorena producens TaxID=1155739 RepID=UPI003C74AEE6